MIYSGMGSVLLCAVSSRWLDRVSRVAMPDAIGHEVSQDFFLGPGAVSFPVEEDDEKEDEEAAAADD